MKINILLTKSISDSHSAPPLESVEVSQKKKNLVHGKYQVIKDVVCVWWVGVGIRRKVMNYHIPWYLSVCDEPF